MIDKCRVSLETSIYNEEQSKEIDCELYEIIKSMMYHDEAVDNTLSPHTASYEAICGILDLAAQGDLTDEEIIYAIRERVVPTYISYVEDAFEEDPSHYFNNAE